MKEVSIVRLDLAKRVFQVHAAGGDLAPVPRPFLRLSRAVPQIAQIKAYSA